MKRIALLAAVLFGLANVAGAAIVVDYDKDAQVGGNMDNPGATEGLELDGDGNANDAVRQIALDDATPYSDTAGDYDGPPFFIAFKSTQHNTSEGWDSRDSNAISIRNQVGGTGAFGNPKAADNHIALYFKPSAAGRWVFDDTSSMAIDFHRRENLGDIRWLVRDGTQFYVSETTLSGDTTFDNAAGLLTEMWAAYDPASDANFDQAGATFATPTTALTDLTAFGLMTDQDTMNQDVRYWLGINTFTVDAAVPEPATLALLGLGGLGMLIRRKR